MLNEKKGFGRFKVLKSLKIRIFFIIMLIGLIPTSIMRYGILNNYEERAIGVRKNDISIQMKILANHLISYNYLRDPSSEVVDAELEQLSNLYDGRVLIVDQNFKIIKDTYGISEGKIIVSEEIIKGFKGESIANYDDENHFIEMTTPIIDSTEDKALDEVKKKPEAVSPQENIKGVMLVSVSTESIMDSLDILGRKALILFFTMFSLVFVVAVACTTGLTVPFKRLTQAVTEVNEGFTTEIVSERGYSETELIVDTFNQILSRMKVLDDSRQEFVSNVSHELKTPITSMKVLADSLIMQDNLPIEIYQEFMLDIAAEVERENKIINDLLSLVRMDRKSADLNIEAIHINDLLELIMKRLRPIANQKNITLEYESIRPVTADVDEVKLTLGLSNLVENAIKYNKEEGWVKVILDADHQFFTVAVEDSGVGIAEEEIEHIFERFYRVDKSHSREIGGTGLGLSLTRSAILMHRGAIKVTSQLGEGTTFLVKIPLSYIT